MPDELRPLPDPVGPGFEWLKKWAPRCPDGNQQRLLEIVAFRLKGPDYLQLRVILQNGDHGACQIIIDERLDRIYVRALACLKEEEEDITWSGTDEVDCGCCVWLDEPLGERVVIDVETLEELPLLIPRWGTGKPSLHVPRPPGLLWPPDAISKPF